MNGFIGFSVEGQTMSVFVSANSELADNSVQYAIGESAMTEIPIQLRLCIQIIQVMVLESECFSKLFCDG